MAYWLLKTEPSCYSFADLETEKQTRWDGITNAQALKYLREFKKGDQALIYHTGDERAVVGIAEVTTNAYVDPKLGDPKLAVVDLKPVRRLKTPITLAEIKADESFQDFALVRQGRLSVVPVTAAQWKKLAK